MKTNIIKRITIILCVILFGITNGYAHGTFIIHDSYAITQQTPIRSILFDLEQLSDVFITNIVPGTTLGLNQIEVYHVAPHDLVQIYPDVDVNAERIQLEGEYEQMSLFPTFMAFELSAGRYIVRISGRYHGSVGLPYGHAETLIVGIPSESEFESVTGNYLADIIKIPFDRGFYFNMPIETGLFHESFTYQREAVFEDCFIPFHTGQGANIVYSFQLEGANTWEVQINAEGGYSYLLNEDKEELAAGGTATAILPQGKYYCVLENRNLEEGILPFTITGTVQTDAGSGEDDEWDEENWQPIGEEITTTYQYNIRSWITEISSDKFTQGLSYAGLYNGNISSMTWKAGTETTTRGYKFAYDGLSRLTNATYGEGTSITGTNKFGETPTYDKHGNILTMKRYDNGSLNTLALSYNGNQLSGGYTFDKNGNMTKDSSKGITAIEYNSLNLSSKVVWSASKYTKYVYDAAGNKLQTRHVNGSTTTTTDYCGNVIYEDGVLKYILTEDGYVTLSGSTPNYFYYLKDHLGNNRVVVDSRGAEQQVNHYYPFGEMFASTNNTMQPYKFGGKELDENTRLYDFHARQMNGNIGRFTTMDPLAEKKPWLTPYHYCSNNPIGRLDLDGKDDYFFSDGRFSYRTQTGSTIYVNNMVLSRIDLTVASNRQAVANVVGYYGISIGLSVYAKGMVPIGSNPVGTLGLGAYQGKENAIAYTDKNDIFVNKAGNKINGFLDDANNLTNTLVHEKIHKEQYLGKKELQKESREIDAISAQMGHSSYSKTTKAFQRNTLNYLVQNIKKMNMNDDRIEEIINKANSSNSHYQLQFERYSSAGDGYRINITER